MAARARCREPGAAKQPRRARPGRSGARGRTGRWQRGARLRRRLGRGHSTAGLAGHGRRERSRALAVATAAAGKRRRRRRSRYLSGDRSGGAAAPQVPGKCLPLRSLTGSHVPLRLGQPPRPWGGGMGGRLRYHASGATRDLRPRLGRAGTGEPSRRACLPPPPPLPRVGLSRDAPGLYPLVLSLLRGARRASAWPGAALGGAQAPAQGLPQAAAPAEVTRGAPPGCAGSGFPPPEIEGAFFGKLATPGGGKEGRGSPPSPPRPCPSRSAGPAGDRALRDLSRVSPEVFGGRRGVASPFPRRTGRAGLPHGARGTRVRAGGMGERGEVRGVSEAVGGGRSGSGRRELWEKLRPPNSGGGRGSGGLGPGAAAATTPLRVASCPFCRFVGRERFPGHVWPRRRWGPWGPFRGLGVCVFSHLRGWRPLGAVCPRASEVTLEVGAVAGFGRCCGWGSAVGSAFLLKKPAHGLIWLGSPKFWLFGCLF